MSTFFWAAALEDSHASLYDDGGGNQQQDHYASGSWGEMTVAKIATRMKARERIKSVAKVTHDT